jgi:hypothetical protein
VRDASSTRHKQSAPHKGHVSGIERSEGSRSKEKGKTDARQHESKARNARSRKERGSRQIAQGKADTGTEDTKHCLGAGEENGESG